MPAFVCLIFGDPVEDAFTINISKNKQISHLKVAIKEKIEHHFEKIDANELELWKVNISINDKSKFEQLETHTSNELILKDVLEGVMITDIAKKIKKVFNSPLEEEHVHIIIKPPAHIPKLDIVETENVKCPYCQATFKSKNRNYRKHIKLCRPNVALGMDLGSGLVLIRSENVIPWLSSVSDKQLSQLESLCRDLVIAFSRSNDISHNRKEMDRLTLSAYGRTFSEAFNRNICVVCGVRPERFHNNACRREYEKISRICPACWETETLSPDDTTEQIMRSQQILLGYGREFILCPKLPHAWKCLRCKKVIHGRERLTHAVKCRVCA
ncbi:hypothetical protein RclHR1_05050004 [Rhizophagus clarus]|uniref:Crinkler effector protein N-terminal domain-containing protein n=1 Tax=Rhizophagus clarus TaxID=94130 RepID=A0A2Z6SE90_9GLOM|nr:hypothetical protein RclHR1_05050004 [Rhizophagus clarus]GES80972.1 hypothetical protein GLOIN_2v1471163 [Rhizophagus clarus]